jgi:RNA polymerase sigma-70 factor (ECF subfamily)
MLFALMSESEPTGSPWPAAAAATLHDQAATLEPAVRALLARVLHERADHPDVRDGCHEVFRRALEGAERVRAGEPVRPWVLGIARHVALDALRARRRALARAAGERRERAPDAPALVEQLADPGLGPEALLEQSEDARRARDALGKLGPEQREVLWLLHVEGLGYREISERLAIPLGTVCTWIMRGRKQLARVLRDQDEACVS